MSSSLGRSSSSSASYSSSGLGAPAASSSSSSSFYSPSASPVAGGGGGVGISGGRKRNAADKDTPSPQIQQQLAAMQQPVRFPFGPAWRIPPDEEHLWSRSLLNTMKMNSTRALASIQRIRDSNFVRDFHLFAEQLNLKPANYKALSSRREIIACCDMIKMTLKSSVLSVQSLVWRTGKLRASVAVLQRWMRAKIYEIRRVKMELKIRWRQVETRAREKIKEEIDRRNALQLDVVLMAAASASQYGSAASAQLAARVASAARSHSPGAGGASHRPPSASQRAPPSPSSMMLLSSRSNSPAAAAAAASISLRSAVSVRSSSAIRGETSPGSSSMRGGGGSGGGGSSGSGMHQSKRRSPAEQRINDLLWSLLSDAWMDDEVMDAAINRLLMHRRCRYVDCFRVWRATSMRDFNSRADAMKMTRTAKKLLECAMSLRFPSIRFTMDGVSIDELAYHAVAHQMKFPMPRPTVPPARKFVQFMPKPIWDATEQESEGSSGGGASNNGDDDDGGGGNAVGEKTKEGDGDGAGADAGDNNDSNDGLDAAASVFAQASEKPVDISNCSFSPTIVARREPVALLPSQSMCFRKAKKEVTATINEALNTRVENSDDDNDNDGDDDGQNKPPQRTGWTQEEIAEIHEGRFVDPISMVLRQTRLPIEELSGGILPPFNFYHALLGFHPGKIFLYAFMKQAVSGRRVLLESQLHGPEPREQCEEAIRVIRTWVYLRTVRALSSEEILTLNITPRERYARDGSPMPRVATFLDNTSSNNDPKRMSPRTLRREAAKVAAVVDHAALRVSPPRVAIERLMKPDVPASTSRLSTILAVEAVSKMHGRDDAMNIKPYESVFVPEGVSIEEMLTGKRDGNETGGSNNNKQKPVRKQSLAAALMTTDQMARQVLSKVSPFRRASPAATAASGRKQQPLRPASAAMTTSSEHTDRSTPVPGASAAPVANPVPTAGAAPAAAATQQQQHQPFSARSFPVDLPAVRALLPPPSAAGAAILAATARTTTKRNPAPPWGSSPPAATTARAAAPATSNAAAPKPSAVAPSATAASQPQRHQPAPPHHHHHYINTSGFACTQDEYVERELTERMAFERRYVAPIRQRRSELNSRLAVSSERRAAAVEMRLKGGNPPQIARWHPGE